VTGCCQQSCLQQEQQAGSNRRDNGQNQAAAQCAGLLQQPAFRIIGSTVWRFYSLQTLIPDRANSSRS
jgi:hypothetical protein